MPVLRWRSGGFVGFFDGMRFFLKKGLLEFILCVLSPALFTTKRAAKFAEFEQEIVLKNNLNKAVDDRLSMTYLTRRFNAESLVPETLELIFDL